MLVWMTSSIEHTRDEMRELETLLSRIAQGDKEALGMLYERTHGAIYGFALSLVRRPSDAEDILQETFLRAYAGAERYRPEADGVDDDHCEEPFADAPAGRKTNKRFARGRMGALSFFKTGRIHRGPAAAAGSTPAAL